MAFHKQRNIYLLIGIVLTVAGVFFYAGHKNAPPGPANTIVYTTRGFSPSEMVVHVGDEVIFKNSSAVPFWPASNPHPVHGIYPGFDPKVPISGGGEWRFRFTEVGNWNYHDHIKPEFGGHIIVLKEGQTQATKRQCGDLSALDSVTKEQCWEDILTAKIKKLDIKGALATFAQLYRTDKDFSIGCHYRAHLMGDAFYNYIVKRRALSRVDLPPETIYCGYGFFHGLFEHMIRDEGKNFSVGKLRTMCDELDKKYGDRIPLIRINCFHGAGHGITQDPPDTALWGNAQSVIDPPLAICDHVSDDQGEIEQCYEGVFNVLVDWTWRKQYGFSPDIQDPFALCRHQQPRHQKGCYYEMVMRLGDLEDRDLVSLTQKYIDPIADDEIAELVTISLVAAMMSVSVVDADQTSYIYTCRAVAPRLSEGCLMGVMMGFRAHGDPGQEYKKALSFCTSPVMTPAEKAICYRELTINNQYIYTKEKVTQICDQYEKGYQHHCNGR